MNGYGGRHGPAGPGELYSQESVAGRVGKTPADRGVIEKKYRRVHGEGPPEEKLDGIEPDSCLVAELQGLDDEERIRRTLEGLGLGPE